MYRDTELLHRGNRVSGKHDTPECAPLFLTNAFNVADLDELDFVYDGGGFAYNRSGNPNRELLGELMTHLEGGEDSLICSCGMAAITTALQALLQSGDHLLSDRALYGETIDVISRVLGKFGVEVTYVDFTDPDQVRQAIRPNTKVFYTESESNPMMTLVDLDRISALAHDNGCALVVDNTFTTPYALRPLEHGADLVVNSLTKFINGHGDALAGSVTGKKELIRKAYDIQQFTGSVADPFSCWLISRSIRTLGLRMQRHMDNAARLARALEADPRVVKVIYPGLDSHPQHQLAGRLLEHGGGAMLSLYVPEDRDKLNRFLRRLQYVHYAMTLGGPRTTLSHPVTSSHHDMPEAERQKLGITFGLLRVSVGLEDPEDLIADFSQALTVFQ